MSKPENKEANKRWLLDKNERTISPKENKDLKDYLNKVEIKDYITKQTAK